MASIVLGVATSHTPLLILPADRWDDYARRDRSIPELVFPPDGLAMDFDKAVDGYVSTEIQDRPRELSIFQRQYDASQEALDALADSLRASRPDVVVIISDDQDEWFYDDNMPSLAIYWGDTVPIKRRPEPTVGDEVTKELDAVVNDGYAAADIDVPVAAPLGRFVLEHLLDHDFDISSMTYVRDTYSGSVRRRSPRPDGTEVEYAREQPDRPVGLPHGFSFIVQRLLAGIDAPILPIIQNTCYPPNSLTPRRSYALGEAVGDALRSWPEDIRVAVVASGGLSHFVVDEIIDRAVLDGLQAGDKEALTSLPRERLRSATSECLNWVALGGVVAAEPLRMELLGYEPVYRTEAGTGAGLGFAQWVAPEAAAGDQSA